MCIGGKETRGERGAPFPFLFTSLSVAMEPFHSAYGIRLREYCRRSDIGRDSSAEGNGGASRFVPTPASAYQPQLAPCCMMLRVFQLLFCTELESF